MFCGTLARADAPYHADRTIPGAFSWNADLLCRGASRQAEDSHVEHAIIYYKNALYLLWIEVHAAGYDREIAAVREV
ncbi:hypothetical protein AWV79_02845 [Cupriavidus sp. UYMMa02A]|nr:hypothetical protein AWV79_02845 [Cupriavidus sp. UYMMa02A]